MLGEYLGAGASTTKLLLHLNGNSTDSSGNGNNLTNNNGVVYSQGKFGLCADFGTGNTNKNLTIASDLGIAGNGNQTMSCWIKVNSEPATNGQYRFIDHRDGGTGAMTSIEYKDASGTKSLNWYFSRNGVADYFVTKTITLGTTNWYHVLLTYDGSNVRGYFNGEYVGATAGSGTGSDIVDGFSLGSSANGYLFSNMMIDEAFMENIAWTPQQVAKYYTNSRGFYATL